MAKFAENVKTLVKVGQATKAANHVAIAQSTITGTIMSGAMVSQERPSIPKIWMLQGKMASQAAANPAEISMGIMKIQLYHPLSAKKIRD